MPRKRASTPRHVDYGSLAFTASIPSSSLGLRMPRIFQAGALLARGTAAVTGKGRLTLH